MTLMLFTQTSAAHRSLCLPCLPICYSHNASQCKETGPNVSINHMLYGQLTSPLMATHRLVSRSGHIKSKLGISADILRRSSGAVVLVNNVCRPGRNAAFEQTANWPSFDRRPYLWVAIIAVHGFLPSVWYGLHMRIWIFNNKQSQSIFYFS